MKYLLLIAVLLFSCNQEEIQETTPDDFIIGKWFYSKRVDTYPDGTVEVLPPEACEENSYNIFTDTYIENQLHYDTVDGCHEYPLLRFNFRVVCDKVMCLPDLEEGYEYEFIDEEGTYTEIYDAQAIKRSAIYIENNNLIYTEYEAYKGRIRKQYFIRE